MPLDPLIAQITIYGCNFAPRDWALCNGQLLSIQQYSSVFTCIGTTYGGDGRTTFALPNLQGKLPIHSGNGVGLTPRVLGEDFGIKDVTLLGTQIPAHSHTAGEQKSPVASAADTINPSQAFLAKVPNVKLYSNNSTSINNGVKANIDASGRSLPHNNLMPYLALNFCIALAGIYPQRP